MPAVSADTQTLRRLGAPAPGAHPREAEQLLPGRIMLEGEGFQVRRPFRDLHDADPFLLLDHMGAVEYAPGEAKGAPDHPHRGFETVTYIIDGAMEHRDSTGGGGLISNGATQWMTAGAGIVHSEMPPQELVARGGLFHGVQLWVNLPAAEKWTPPRYQDIGGGSVTLLTSPDAGALVRIIAGEIDGHQGPGVTHTPIALVHATLSPGAELALPWERTFNAMVYVLNGRVLAGSKRTAVQEGELIHLGSGDHVLLRAAGDHPAPADVLVLGGRPIREPIAHYGPFVMNHMHEIQQAVDDYRSGRMGRIPPATTVTPSTGADAAR